MNTKNLHLTDLSNQLKNDHNGRYRRKLLDTLGDYQRQLSHTNIPGALKAVFSHIQQAITCAQTILATEE